MLRTSLACVPLALWCVLVMRLAGTGGGLVREAMWLTVAIVGGTAVFVAGSAALGSPERVALWGMLPHRRRP